MVDILIVYGVPLYFALMSGWFMWGLSRTHPEMTPIIKTIFCLSAGVVFPAAFMAATIEWFFTGKWPM